MHYHHHQCLPSRHGAIYPRPEQPLQKRKAGAKRVGIIFSIVAGVVMASLILGAGVDRRERERFAKMNDAQHFGAAREAYLDNLWNVADDHLAAIKRPTPDLQTQIDDLRGRISRARAEDLDRQAKGRELQQKEEDRPGLLDSITIVDHTKNMMIFNSGRWFAGEYRLCEITVSENPVVLTCSDLPNGSSPIRMDVTFHGSMENAKWDCKRREEDIYCEPQKQ
jgi:hypothetical protein